MMKTILMRDRVLRRRWDWTKNVGTRIHRKAMEQVWQAMQTDSLRDVFLTDVFPPSLDAFLKELEEDPYSFAMLLKIDKQPAAFLLLTNILLTGTAPYEVTANFYVMPAFRSVSACLWLFFRNWLRKAGCRVVIALIHPEHMQCRMFTRSMGFQSVKAVKHQAWFHGNPVEMLVYKLGLTS